MGDSQIELPGLDRATELRVAAHAWAATSSRAQGLPAKISDVSVLGAVATLLGGAPSGMPNRRDSVRVKLVAPANRRSDDDVIDDRRDDRVLARQRQRRPLLAEQ